MRLILCSVCVASTFSNCKLHIETAMASTPADCAEVWSEGYGLAADFDENCYVDFQDVAALAADWLGCTDPEDPNCETPWATGVSAIVDGNSPADTLIFDWALRDTDNAFTQIVPVPHPGADWPAGYTVYHNLYDELYTRGQPLCLMLVDATGPAYGWKDPNALLTLISYVPRLDMVFADFEGPHRDDDVQMTVQQVRSHPSSDINAAYIGNYAQQPGTYDESQHYPWIVDRTEEDLIYRTSGLNIAQPSCYPYEYLEVHTSSYIWGDYVAPNKRSALFWAPLERLSVAKRALPDGHLLIPWVAAFIPWDGYEADPPPVEDLKAIIQHTRLRGADGYYSLGLIAPEEYTDYWPAHYRYDIWEAWHSLEWLFGGTGDTNILNLDTDKLSGLQWSGVKHGPKAAVIISNLGNAAGRVDFPDIPELPDFSPWVEPNSHLLLTYGSPVNCKDIEPMGYASPFDLNKDCHANFKDFALLAADWLECAEPADGNCQKPWLNHTVYWCDPSTWPSGNRWPDVSDYNSIIDCNVSAAQVEGPWGHILEMVSGDVSFSDWDWGSAGVNPGVTSIYGTTNFNMAGARFADEGGAILNVGCSGGEPNVVFSGFVRWADNAVMNEIHVCGGSIVFGGGLFFGDDGGGIFEVSGGNVTIDANLDFRCRTESPEVFGELTVSAGQMLITGELTGGQNRPMTVTISGGMLTAGSVYLPRENGPAIVDVTGGQFQVDGALQLGSNAWMSITDGTVSVGSLSLDGSACIDVCGGTLIIDGCVDVSGYVAQGLLTGCGSTQTLWIGCEDGKTIITYQEQSF